MPLARLFVAKRVVDVLLVVVYGMVLSWVCKESGVI